MAAPQIAGKITRKINGKITSHQAAGNVLVRRVFKSAGFGIGSPGS
jgi:hypothetical protein